jgi:hypothetical protein
VLFPIFVGRLLRFLPGRLGADAVLADEPAA